MKIDKLTHSSRAIDYDWLIGRKVVEAHMGGAGSMNGIPGTEYTVKYYEGHIPETRYREYADGYIVLDNGVKAYVKANEGCGGCSSGWYRLEHLATVDNIITSVKPQEDNIGDNSPYSYNEERSYKLFVYADNKKINMMQVDGDDGNGYYGTGFELIVVFPDTEIPADA